MSAAQFTKGPWVLWVAAGEAVRVLDSRCGKAIVAYADFPKSASALAERTANARLIAAAPELYEALDRIWNGDGLTVEAKEAAQLALAKARGQ